MARGQDRAYLSPRSNLTETVADSASSPSPRTAILNVVGLTTRLIGEHTPFLRRFLDRPQTRLARVKPLLPAVTSTMQATYLTGRTPGEHGIVGNMWYDRDYAEHRCWKQSNHLVQGQKLWERLRDENPAYTCAKVFWWNNLYSSADYQITPRPIYRSDGNKLFDVQTWPMGLRDAIREDLGAFPFPAFWGPAAGIASSEWIARAAQWFEERYSPHLNLVYLPHLDYNLQRLGPDVAEIVGDLRDIDRVVGDLTGFLESRGVRVVVLSEYGLVPVKRAIHLNRLFRERGWLVWREELGQEMIDLGNCAVFAIPDHQVAHVYVNQPALRDEVAELLCQQEGIAEVHDRASQAAIGLAHERSGDLVAVSEEDSWFTYYWWEDDRKAPDFARCVDIHRKPGYDPVELFLDPALPFPKLSVAWRLLQKRLGFRMRMDVIPLDAGLVKGSHGCIPAQPEDYPVIAGALPGLEDGALIAATEVHRHLLDFCRQGA